MEKFVEGNEARVEESGRGNFFDGRSMETQESRRTERVNGLGGKGGKRKRGRKNESSVLNE